MNQNKAHKIGTSVINKLDINIDNKNSGGGPLDPYEHPSMPQSRNMKDRFNKLMKYSIVNEFDKVNDIIN